MQEGWLKLTQLGGSHSPEYRGLAVYVWAPDIEMCSARPDGGSVVYLHHDKIAVAESAENVIEAADAITNPPA